MCNSFFVIIRCLEDNDFRSEKWIDKKLELFMEMFPFIQVRFISKMIEEKSYNKVISKHNYILSTLSYIFKRIWNQSSADK